MKTFFDLGNVFNGEIKVKNDCNHWIEIDLAKVEYISFIENVQVFENLKLDVLKVGTMHNDKFHSFQFVFNENCPVIFNGQLCKDFQSLENEIIKCK